MCRQMLAFTYTIYILGPHQPGDGLWIFINKRFSLNISTFKNPRKFVSLFDILKGEVVER